MVSSHSSDLKIQNGDENRKFTFDGELMEGDFPAKQRKLVAAWSVLNSDEPEADWELARNKQDLFRIKPL